MFTPVLIKTDKDGVSKFVNCPRCNQRIPVVLDGTTVRTLTLCPICTPSGIMATTITKEVPIDVVPVKEPVPPLDPSYAVPRYPIEPSTLP